MTRTSDRSVRERVADTLADHPVRLGLLFGSRAGGETHERSDVDVAVVFEQCEPGDPEYTETLLRLGADLAIELDTDDIDLVDLRRLSPSIARVVLTNGELLVGDEADLDEFRDHIPAESEDETRSPSERFDAALARVDEHLA